MASTRPSPALRQGAIFAFTLLAIEFLDEFVYGAREVAWPLIRDDLRLSYGQIGLLLGLPNLLNHLIEPALGILGDVWKRRALILGGGMLFALALLVTALSRGYGLLLLSFLLLNPASGAFVTLSQATLMDADPSRHEQNMARWTAAGAVGVVLGPLALGAAASLGWGWRGPFFLFAGLTVPLVALVGRASFPRAHSDGPRPDLRETLTSAWRALRRGVVLRWLILLPFSDLMLDVLLGFLALYFVDVVGVNPAQAGMAVAVWTGASFVGDLLLIPLLERVRGLSYLRLSAVAEGMLFMAFLLLPGFWPKLAALALLGLLNAGWYSILKARPYSAMPGQSGTVMALDNLFRLLGSLMPLGLGFIAQRYDLRVTMWLLLAGPLALWVGLPREVSKAPATSDSRG